MKIRILGLVTALFILFIGCDKGGGDTGGMTSNLTPSNLQVTIDVLTDGSGTVNFTATADDAIVYYYYFGESANEDRVASPTGIAQYTYGKSGTNSYTVRVEAAATGGATIEKSENIEVTVSFEPPAEITTALTGGASKSWYWKQSVAGHLGLGPANTSTPDWYSAAQDEKVTAGCLYDDVMTFTDNGDGTFNYTLNNGGDTYFQADVFGSQTGQSSTGNDECASFNTAANNTILFRPVTTTTSPSTGITMTVSGGGFLSYSAGGSTYEIMSISDDELQVRMQENGTGQERAWYHTFGTTKESRDPTFTGATGSGNNDVLVWADEFDVDGAPNNGNWTYNTGRGDNGWGNGEEQTYTRRPENVIIEDGILKIHAIRESFEGAQYTSARILTQGLVNFTYCKVEARAKLPTGVGTWPAIWMLGSNFGEVGWPACGEIDIMEHVGRYQDRLYSTLHYPGNSGGNGVGKHMMSSDLSTEFHTYTLDWTSSKIEFAIDGTVWHTITNHSGIPFNHDFFLIMNVAMGGGFGGPIDNGFDRSTMEVDYVRVYQ